MSDDKKVYIAQLTDKQGKTWQFEGWCERHPIWVEQDKASPVLLTELNAYTIAMGLSKEGETPSVKKS